MVVMEAPLPAVMKHACRVACDVNGKALNDHVALETAYIYIITTGICRLEADTSIECHKLQNSVSSLAAPFEKINI